MTDHADLIAEEWRSVVGYEGYYEVSNLGHVRSVDRLVEWNGTKKLIKGSTMRGTPKVGSGYRQVKLSKDGKGKTLVVHRLVLEAFVGPCPPGAEGLHWDDDKENNALSNLRWGTRRENLLDRVRNGRHHFATRTHCSKGHPLSGENLGFGSHRERFCRECKKERARVEWLRKKDRMKKEAQS